jgi:hypothetical protein
MPIDIISDAPKRCTVVGIVQVPLLDAVCQTAIAAGRMNSVRAMDVPQQESIRNRGMPAFDRVGDCCGGRQREVFPEDCGRKRLRDSDADG